MIYMSSRRTIMDGEVVTFAESFVTARGTFGLVHDPVGSFVVTASRNAVHVERAYMQSGEAIDRFVSAVKLAKEAHAVLSQLAPLDTESRFPSDPTPAKEQA